MVDMLESIHVDRELRESLREENVKLSREREANTHQLETLVGQVEELCQQ